MIYSSQEELDKALAYWVGVMRLQDWDIKAEVVRATKMSKPGRAAENAYSVCHRCSSIHLLDPGDHPDGPWTQDHEEDLVHELLHLYTGEFVKEVESADPELMERLHSQHEALINRTARVMVALNSATTQGGAQWLTSSP